jgi:hypothetical protein
LKESVNCEAKNAAIAGCIVGIFKPEYAFLAGLFAKWYVGLFLRCEP